MTNLNKIYNFTIGGNKVQVKKVYRTRTQYEYHLKIFMGESTYESTRKYKEMHLTLKGAVSHAQYVIEVAPQPRIELVYINPNYKL